MVRAACRAVYEGANPPAVSNKASVVYVEITRDSQSRNAGSTPTGSIKES